MPRQRSTQDLIFERIRAVVDDRRASGHLLTTRSEIVDHLMQPPDVAAIARDRANSSTLSPEGWLGNSFAWFTAQWGSTRHTAGLAPPQGAGYWAIDPRPQGTDPAG